MKTIGLIAGAIVGFLAVVIAVAFLVGRTLPVRHRASREARIAAPPPAVFAAIVDVARYPEWRKGVTAVEMLAPEEGRRRWRERSGGDVILYEAIAEIPNERLVTRIADPTLPFGGTWTFELRPDGPGTVLSITEDGEVFAPLYRFVSRYVMGHHGTIDGYLRDLAARVRT